MTPLCCRILFTLAIFKNLCSGLNSREVKEPAPEGVRFPSVELSLQLRIVLADVPPDDVFRYVVDGTGSSQGQFVKSVPGGVVCSASNR